MVKLQRSTRNPGNQTSVALVLEFAMTKDQQEDTRINPKIEKTLVMMEEDENKEERQIMEVMSRRKGGSREKQRQINKEQRQGTKRKKRNKQNVEHYRTK